MKIRHALGAALVALLSGTTLFLTPGPAFAQTSGSPCAPGQPSDRPPGSPAVRPAGRPPQYPPGKCQLLLSRSVVPAGGSLQAAGAGFAPGSTVNLSLAGASVGSAQADGSGAFSADVLVPASTRPGNHTVTASGAGSDGGTQVLAASLEVTAAGARGSAPGSAADSRDLPRTGATSTVPLALAGGALLVAGSGAVVAARRRRTADV